MFAQGEQLDQNLREKCQTSWYARSTPWEKPLSGALQCYSKPLNYSDYAYKNSNKKYLESSNIVPTNNNILSLL